MRNYSSLKVLFSHVFDDVISIRERISVPPIRIASIFVNDLNHDASLLHVYFSIIFLAIGYHHFDWESDVFLEFFGYEVQLNALRQGLQKFPLEVVLFFSAFFVLELEVAHIALFLFNLLSQLLCLLLSHLSLYLYLVFFFLLHSFCSHLFALLQTFLQFHKFIFLFFKDLFSLFLHFPLLLFNLLLFYNLFLEIKLVLS